VLRRPRFERTPEALSLQLTKRDREILRHVATHRFLNSHQLLALVGGSPQHFLRRLQRLFHHGYLDRPRSQIRYFSEEGSQPLAYALGRKGARVLATPTRQRPRQDNRNIKQLYLQHTLLVTDVLVAFVRACRSHSDSRLLLEEDLAPEKLASAAFHWAVTTHHEGQSKRVGVVPDRTFALESKSTGERVLFFVEADRATMPLTRRSLAQSSMLRKLLAYEATWRQGLHRERFGCSRFRVLVVTSSAERARNLVELCAGLNRGRGLFLFTDVDTLHARVIPYTNGNVFDLPWLCADGGHERLSDLWTTPVGHTRAA
jgi:hypothetical protein